MQKKTAAKPTKKPPKLVPVGKNTGRGAKKGNPTPKTKKKRSIPRFYKIEIRITAEEYVRGQPYFEDKKYLHRFVLDAYREKVNRSEAHDKAGRQQALNTNIGLLVTVMKEAAAQGQLDFLREIFKGPDVG